VGRAVSGEFLKLDAKHVGQGQHGEEAWFHHAPRLDLPERRYGYVGSYGQLFLSHAVLGTQRAEPGGEPLGLLTKPAFFASSAPCWHVGKA